MFLPYRIGDQEKVLGSMDEWFVQHRSDNIDSVLTAKGLSWLLPLNFDSGVKLQSVPADWKLAHSHGYCLTASSCAILESPSFLNLLMYLKRRIKKKQDYKNGFIIPHVHPNGDINT